MLCVVFAIVAVVLALLGQAQDGLGWEHVLRAWDLGLMITFSFCVGGLALLMVQYCSGGKWGLLLRRPLEAMSRTLPLVFLFWLPIAVFQKALFMWANHGIVDKDVKMGWLTPAQVEAINHCIAWKRPMLNIQMFWIVGLICFAIWGTVHVEAEFVEPEARRPGPRNHAVLDQEV